MPGLAAKPVLDLMPGLPSFEDGAAMVSGMERLGYSYKGEYGIPRRHYFSKPIDGDDAVWQHNVHCFAVHDPEYVRHLVFRDALRGDATVRAGYEQLKRELAARHRTDVEAYARAKSAFVEDVIVRFGGPRREWV